jgi:hypothetical protein
MVKKAFYSFHYAADAWRASQVRNSGVVEGNVPVSDNDWEEVKSGGDAAIKQWIDSQMSGRSCAVVLIGAGTAGRKWIDYEIEKAWNARKGLVGVYIHNLLDSNQTQSTKGKNPFDTFTLKDGTVKLSTIVKAYDPPYKTSTNVYDYIKSNLASWVDEAIEIRDGQ